MALNAAEDVYHTFKEALRRRLMDVLGADAQQPPQSVLTKTVITEQLDLLLQDRAYRAQTHAITVPLRDQLVNDLLQEMAGTGPLDALLKDPEISEIMVHGPERIFVERHGRIEQIADRFRDRRELALCVERLLGSLGQQVTEAQPFVDAALPNGMRLNVIIPPASPDGPTLTIRKNLRLFTLEDLVANGTLTVPAAEFLAACIQAKLNIIISGGTSTGKTTLVTALSAHLAPEDRVVTIENVSELQLTHRTHWIRLVGRAPNIQGKGEISIRHLVANALRMRPDRIILGEARGGEALDIIQAMQTGHKGCITVLHADSPAGAIDRLETLMLLSGIELSAQACRKQIGRAINLAIHMARLPDGTRRIVSVTEVTYDTSHGVALRDIFTLRFQPRAGEERLHTAFQPTGHRPQFLERFAAYHCPVKSAWFQPVADQSSS